MKTSFLSFLFLIINGVLCKSPNIITIVIDDMGFADNSLNGDDFVTPNIKALADSGIQFTRFYAAQTCTPSRSMFMTGRHVIRYGMQDSVIHSTEPRGVSLEEKFISNKLQDSGYNTVAIGKWHLGMHMVQFVPISRGFDNSYGILTGGGSHTGHFSASQTFTARGSSVTTTFTASNILEDNEYSSDNKNSKHSSLLYSEMAQKYINDFLPSDDPLFMYLAYQAIHDPLEVGEEGFISNTACALIEDEDRQTICGMMAEMDHYIGQIKTTLESIDEWDNTVVAVLSDNGGELSHGSLNTPFRGEKSDYFDGGVRVPLVLAGGYVEKTLAANNVDPYTSDALTHITDLHASLLSAAGYDSSSDSLKMDGVDMWDNWMTKSEEALRDELLINLNSYKYGSSFALIKGDFKYMKNGEPEETSIYSSVKTKLSETTKSYTSTELDTIITGIVANIVSDQFYLFNIVKNPSESELEDCEDAESCTNLIDNSDYASVLAEMQALIANYQSESVDSTFTWIDDGYLANPNNFDDAVWQSWRDETGMPLAQNFGTLSPTMTDDLFSTFVGMWGVFSSSATTSTVSLFGMSTTTTTSSATMFVTLMALLVGCVAFVAFEFGKRRSPYQRIPY